MILMKLDDFDDAIIITLVSDDSSCHSCTDAGGNIAYNVEKSMVVQMIFK